MVNVKGKWALITGASRGIGYLSAIFMAQQGCNLILHSRSLEGTRKVKAEVEALGVAAHCVAAELNDLAAVEKMLSDIDALNVPVTTMETAGEGGPWGMALLAAYMQRKESEESLEDYLQNRAFTNAKTSCLAPTAEGVDGFAGYITRYKAALDAQKAAAKMQ